MLKVFYRLIIACLFLLSAAYASSTVEKITVEGMKALKKDTVISAISVEKGDEISDNDITTVIRDVYKTGFFEHVGVENDHGNLIIKVIEKPIISAVKVTGYDGISSADEMQEALKKSNLVVGKLLNEAAINGFKNALVNEYKLKGFYNAKASSKIKPVSRSKVDLSISIDAGEVVTINTIKITHNDKISSAEILDVMHLAERGLISMFFGTDAYSEEKLEMDLGAINALYLDNGFLDFKILSHDTHFSKDTADITIDVSEGKKYKVSGYKISGDYSMAKAEIPNLITIEKGDEFSRKNILLVVDSINNLLANRGYANANVNVGISSVNKSDHTVELDFSIVPGNKLYVKHIKFRNNYLTDDIILRQEMQQFEGSLYQKDKVMSSLRRLNNLGYLKNVNCSHTDVVDTNWVDISCEVEETLASTLTGQIGYSDVEGLLYSFNFKQNNFLGTGNIISLEFNRSEMEKTYRIHHSWPHLTLAGDSASVSVYYKNFTPNRTNLSQYHTNNYGLSFGYGVMLSDYSNASISSGVENIKITTMGGSPTQITNYINNYGDSFNDFKVGFNWNYNLLDKAIFPTSGLLQYITTEFGIPINDNSDTLSYYKLSYKNSLFKTLYSFSPHNKLILNMNTKLGYGHGLGNQDSDLPFFKNFFAGGIGSIRGFKSNSLGPKGTVVTDTGSISTPLGGDIMLIESANLIIPQSFNENIRFALFLDMGNVFDSSIDWSEIKYSTGVSVQWRTQIAPFEFSLGFPINAKSGDEKEKFAFTISTGF